MDTELPPPAPREPIHTRRVSYAGWRRQDGLWDIEGELIDTKAFAWQSPERGLMPPGDPVHHMRVRVTVDTEMRIVEAHAALSSTPFAECGAAVAPMQRLVGVTLGVGWRRAIETAMSGVRGCTHLRELLFGLGTAAYQTMGQTLNENSGERPRHLGQCIAWDLSGPVTRRLRPAYYEAPQVPAPGGREDDKA